MSLISLFSLQSSDNRDTCNVLYSVNSGNCSAVSAYIDLHRCPCDRITLFIVLAIGISHQCTCHTVICEITGDKLARLFICCIEGNPCINVGSRCCIDCPLCDLHLIVRSNTAARLVPMRRKRIEHHGIIDVINSVVTDIHRPPDVVGCLHEFSVRDLGN